VRKLRASTIRDGPAAVDRRAARVRGGGSGSGVIAAGGACSGSGHRRSSTPAEIKRSFAFRATEAWRSSASHPDTGGNLEPAAGSGTRFAGRQLALDPPGSSDLRAPRTEGLEVANWRDNREPTLKGQRLPLEQYETSFSLAISRGQRASSWHSLVHTILRPPGPRKMEHSSTLGCLGGEPHRGRTLRRGSIGRWHHPLVRNTSGREVLALFVHRDGRRWVAWTPEGFFDASPGGDAFTGYHLNQGREREGVFVRRISWWMSSTGPTWLRSG